MSNFSVGCQSWLWRLYLSISILSASCLYYIYNLEVLRLNIDFPSFQAITHLSLILSYWFRTFINSVQYLSHKKQLACSERTHLIDTLKKLSFFHAFCVSYLLIHSLGYLWQGMKNFSRLALLKQILRGHWTLPTGLDLFLDGLWVEALQRVWDEFEVKIRLSVLEDVIVKWSIKYPTRMLIVFLLTIFYLLIWWLAFLSLSKRLWRYVFLFWGCEMHLLLVSLLFWITD